jgi:hypothetical protein
MHQETQDAFYSLVVCKTSTLFMCVCPCNDTSNLDTALEALRMDISTHTSKLGSDMHLEVAELEDAYFKFTEMANVSNIGT